MLRRDAAHRGGLFALIGMGVLGVGCRHSDLLNVAGPVGVVPSSAINSNIASAEAFVAAEADFENALAGNASSGGLINYGGVLSDEFITQVNNQLVQQSVDERMTGGGAQAESESFNSPAYFPLNNLLIARSNLLLTEGPLVTYAAGLNRAKISEAYALAAYAELFLAEDYCAGVPLNHAIPDGGVVFGQPLSTDSLLGTAEAHFNLALANANGSDSEMTLASIGLGRTLMDRGRLDSAAAVVHSVSTSFVYNLVGSQDGSGTNDLLQPNFYNYVLYDAANYESGCANYINMADREGQNGLPFVSAADPRLVVDSTLWPTCDFVYNGLPNSAWYYPAKFGNPATSISLANGIEARLIEAEYALAQANDAMWLTDLNNLRSTASVPAQSAGLQPLTDPGTDTARIALLFRERAFWLYGTGSRLSDLRRMIRQYGFRADKVFPTGMYQPAIQGLPNANVFSPTYGEDVSLQLPGATGSGDPTYQGCLSPASHA